MLSGQNLTRARGIPYRLEFGIDGQSLVEEEPRGDIPSFESSFLGMPSSIALEYAARKRMLSSAHSQGVQDNQT